ncbi:hypothetical protein N7448_008757 [Penicillium atrosanguineum]|nr:hypothetical protein N7448_008757 [Penicillium atrosanguineum]
MFAPKTSAAPGGLSINTGSANSLFVFSSDSGGANTQSSSTPAATGTTGSLFGNNSSTPQNKPAGSLFGGGLGGGNTQQSQPTGSSMFSGLGGQQQQQQQQQSGTTGGGLFGSSTAATTQPQSGGLFGTAGAGATNSTTQSGTTGGLFGGGLGASTTTQTQQKPAFGGLGGSTTGGLFGGAQNTQQQPQQQQQQQAQKPTLSLFGNQGAAPGGPQPLQQNTTAPNVVPGVKIDVSNLLPTTKFDNCADEIRNHIEIIDNYILNQMKVCHEVADMFPTIEKQGSTIPNDVEFVQGKLETIQHALENDAGDIDQLRGLVGRDAAEAQVAFRAIDTLKLPLQYQSASGGGWWSAQDQKVDRRSLRSTRKNTLALPDDVEGDPSTATSVNGVPVNLVDYFSQRSDEMSTVLERYKGNIKEIEDHLHGVELALNRQISEFVLGPPKSAVNDLAAVLGDVEAGIMGVAARLGGVQEQVQETTLGPLSVGDRLGMN